MTSWIGQGPDRWLGLPPPRSQAVDEASCRRRDRGLQRPGLGDPAVRKAEDGDLVDPLEAPPGGGMTAPLPEVGGRAGEPADDVSPSGTSRRMTALLSSDMRSLTSAPGRDRRSSGTPGLNQRWSAVGWHSRDMVQTVAM
jgi:hypothetical protein